MRNERQIRNLALIGFMGTGKSSVGRMIACRLGFEFLDTDRLIEEQAGKSVSEIFAQDGEAWFREREHQLVQDLEKASHKVIATGGGLAANQANLDSLKRHALVVCLWATPETIWRHVRRQSHRPLLQDPDPQEKIRRLLAARLPYYRQADVLLSIERRSVHQVAQQLLHHFQWVSSPPISP